MHKRSFCPRHQITAYCLPSAFVICFGLNLLTKYIFSRLSRSYVKTFSRRSNGGGSFAAGGVSLNNTATGAQWLLGANSCQLEWRVPGTSESFYRCLPLSTQPHGQARSVCLRQKVFHYVWRAHQMSFHVVVNSRIVCPWWRICSIICVGNDGSASPTRNHHLISNTKYATGKGIFFHSAKMRYHENWSARWVLWNIRKAYLFNDLII